MADYLLAIDQGTTSTRAMLFDGALAPLATAQQEFRQIYPGPGLVEHDPEEIWTTTVTTVRDAMAKADARAADIAAIGIANQRETTIVWDRATGRPIHNAIVWQDRRTADVCETLRQAGHEATIADRTGLLLDPYFSATKIGWLLDHVEGARAAAVAGRLAFGTVDSFLLWRLTGGKVHATDATNAARTLLLDIRNGQWDKDLFIGCADRAAAAGARFGKRLRHECGRSVRRAHSHPGHGRRPAGGDGGPGVLPTRNDEIDLRDRLFRAPQHR